MISCSIHPDEFCPDDCPNLIAALTEPIDDRNYFTIVRRGRLMYWQEYRDEKRFGRLRPIEPWNRWLARRRRRHELYARRRSGRTARTLSRFTEGAWHG